MSNASLEEWQRTALGKEAKSSMEQENLEADETAKLLMERKDLGK